MFFTWLPGKDLGGVKSGALFRENIFLKTADCSLRKLNTHGLPVGWSRRERGTPVSRRTFGFVEKAASPQNEGAGTPETGDSGTEYAVHQNL